MTSMGREPATVHIAAYRSSPRYGGATHCAMGNDLGVYYEYITKTKAQNIRFF